MAKTAPSSNAATANMRFDCFIGAMKALPYEPDAGEFDALLVTTYHPGLLSTMPLYEQSVMPSNA